MALALIKWMPMPIGLCPYSVYGRVVEAYQSNTGHILFHRKPLRPRHPEYKRVGSWVLVKDLKVIRRRYYYGCSPPHCPKRWARLWIYRSRT